MAVNRKRRTTGAVRGGAAANPRRAGRSKESLAHQPQPIIFSLFQMVNEDSFQYAVENTRVLLAPQRRIETFGNTSFRFYLITELMDSVNQVRVRDGHLHAERPQILAPGHYSRLLLEGFGEKARGFADWLQKQGESLAILKYGFQFRRTDVTENVVSIPLDQVVENVRATVSKSNEPLSAIIHGIDDAWEVCLLKFASDLIQQSAGANLGDFRKKGLL